ncbi:MAG: hypothetical protein DSM107014_14945 [Gomphosphaeria aponina SAG 52.96 = DSM 107014]|uniref:C-type lectin domain-containing protein n=1 Tax=Gomphosphaeria aponina SAG 52.96 = DSM 107014 TaxID=1521640 RepID=A0A941GWJ9_9CHRO|nr:hypothetical protein [Gomphosphaeria aponina SAG 52.96 = DSM 107014]
MSNEFGAPNIRGEVLNTIPALSITDFKVVENNPWFGLPVAKFTVKLSGVGNETITAEYATENGTAIAEQDYTITTGTLTFNPGERVKTITVPILQDGITEPTPETFDLVLSKPVNATLSDAVGTSTIIDGGTQVTYKLTNSATWTDAQATARELAGNLVTVNSAAENQFLLGAFGGGGLWIGFNDAAQEGVWEWVNGEPVTYTNWYPDEPNNLGDEDYAHLNLFWINENTGRWNDLTNNPTGIYVPKGGIVEIVINPATNTNDTITGTDDPEAIEGLGGNDQILGKGGNDYLSGGEGNDILDGGTGADLMKGGAGNDNYTVDDLKDIVTEAVAQGTDALTTSATRTLPGNVENLILTGEANINGTGNTLNNILTGNLGNNKLLGNAGNDTLNGKAGTDTLSGGLGNDKYTVESKADTVIELADEGSDVVTAGGNYTLSDNIENLILTGTAINGQGNEQNNNITGNANNNLLIGNEGSDILIGKTGNDILIGGEENDSFVFNLPTEGIDIIIDFTSSEQIRCSATGFGLVKGALNANQFVVGKGALDADDRFIYNAGSLFYDADGLGGTAQVQIATLINAPALAATNITIF